MPYIILKDSKNPGYWMLALKSGSKKRVVKRELSFKEAEDIVRSGRDVEAE